MFTHCRYGIAIACVVLSSNGYSHSVKQKFGSLEDSSGTSRRSFNMSANADVPVYSNDMSAAGFSVSMGRDNYNFQIEEDAENTIEQSVSNSWSVGTSQTWDRITDTRVSASFSEDETSSARSFGGGFSQWFIHETLRLSVDLSRTIIDRQPVMYLDYDSREISLPQLYRLQEHHLEFGI